ncbi:hypothetical protein LCGC14_1488400 [marine sediment metagenome]|uniref:Response regulatory domain-containing protein n=1 Tax=marine sediment metagenome TaxID=412755 RepID=A0A0F9J836_9ZZZZ
MEENNKNYKFKGTGLNTKAKNSAKKIFEEAGFDKWYEKPLNIKEFRENVEALLSY